MKNIILFFIIIIMPVNILWAQQEQIENANTKYNRYAFIKAIDIYEKVLEKGYSSAEMLKKLGNAYYFNADYKNASKWYGELVKMKDSVIEPDYYFRYAQSLKSLEKYQESDIMMKLFDEKKDNDIRAQLFENQPEYLEFIKLQSGRYQIKPITQNSSYSDFAPSFYKGNLVFSSARDTGDFFKYRHSWNNMPFLDLYIASISETGEINNPVKFSKEINTNLHESSTAFTKDGKTMYFTRNSNIAAKEGKEKLTRLKIYKATKQEETWGNVVELPFNNNNYSVAHPALSPDETKLYFASNMPGTYGESDIYVVDILADETYGTPQNLGKNINTESRETFPYVSKSGLLYFSSDGHQGLGGLDVFVTKMIAPTKVGEIINIGEPVNTPLDDFSFIINEETAIGFFASSRAEGFGNDDIYTFTETRPLIFDCPQIVTGTVTDESTGKILQNVKIEIINEKDEIIKEVLTNIEGVYQTTLNCNEGNFIRASKENYLTVEEYVAATLTQDALTVNIALEPTTVVAGTGEDLAKILDLKPIYFDFDKSHIRPDAEIELQKVVAALEKYPTLKIDIRSHTDSRGNDTYNMLLSEKRAKATVNYIVNKGIDISRIMGKGYGETQLINNCSNGVKCSKQEHQLNRRSEFIIIE